jgi:uncharacterized membrane protein YoaK (UPF0700 family)
LNNSSELGIGGRLGMALSLTAIGGFVDAVGWIALFQIFTANMSGNSIHIGMYLGQTDWPNLFRPLCAAVSYVVGMALTRAAIEVAGRSGIRRIASITFTVEALLLALFAHARPAMHLGQLANLYSPAYFTMVALLALAMGVQTATLTRVGALTIYTTFVTGTLTKMTESVTRFAFWVYDEMRRADLAHVLRNMFRQPDARDASALAGTWTCYVLGAASGTILKARWELRALYLPAAVLAIFIIVDQVRPIGVEEEKHQTGQKRT